MKNSMRMVLVFLAALSLTAIAFACDKEKSAAKIAEGTGDQAAAVAVKAETGGCNHAKVAKEEGGCPHAAKAELASYKDDAGGCPFHSKATDAQRAALVKGEPVTLVGHVVCAACDLKQVKDCKSVFKTENGQLYAIVGNDAFEKLAGETKHGEKKVEITGTAAKDSGESIVLLQSYKLLG